MYRNNSPYVHTNIKRMKGYGYKHDPVARGEIFAVGRDVADTDGTDMEGGLNPFKLITDGRRYAEDVSLDILSKSGVIPKKHTASIKKAVAQSRKGRGHGGMEGDGVIDATIQASKSLMKIPKEAVKSSVKLSKMLYLI